MIPRGVHPQSPSRKQWSKPIGLPANARRQSFVQQRIAAIHAEIATLGQSDADIAAKLQPRQAWQDLDNDDDNDDTAVVGVCQAIEAQPEPSDLTLACQDDSKTQQILVQCATANIAQRGQEQQAQQSHQYCATRQASEPCEADAAGDLVVAHECLNDAKRLMACRLEEHAEGCKRQQQEQESLYRAVRQAAERKEAASPAVARTAARRATINATTEFERQAAIEKQEREELAAELAMCAKVRRDVDNGHRQDETFKVSLLQRELHVLQQLQDDDESIPHGPREVPEAHGDNCELEIFVGSESSRSSARAETPTRHSAQPLSPAIMSDRVSGRALTPPLSASRQNALAARRKRLERAAANSAQRDKTLAGKSTPTRRRQQLSKSAANSSAFTSPAQESALSASRQNALSARRRRLERAGRTPFNFNLGSANRRLPLSSRAEFNASPSQTPPSQRRLATRAQRHYAASPVCRSSAETGAHQFRSSADWLLSLREGFTVTSDAREVDETLYL